MLIRQFRLGDNLLTHFRENTDEQMLWQLPSAEDNFEGCNVQRYYLPTAVIKNYNVIINGKNFYDQPIDSYIKRYNEN